MKEDYELLKKYLQNEIDRGNNKTFIFDKDDVIDFKNCNALSYIENMEQEIERLRKENDILKHRLNDVVFGDDYELGARYLRKIGYIDFDEERKVYINKHNNEPFFHKEEKEKDYYIGNEELNEYTEQLEYKLKKKDKEIERLNKSLDVATEMINNKQKEIVRLNNIINELEKWIEENIKLKPLQTTYFFNCDGKQRSISEIELKELKRVFNKLQELKGSNDNG